MIKNKDGSYNKFRLSIILLISIITIFIIGTFIVQNINIPKIELPSWAPTPTPTTSNIIYPPVIESDTSFNTPTSWNWSFGNGTNLSNVDYNTTIWQTPTEQELIVVAGGGGTGGAGESYVGVGGGKNGSYSNYTYIVGGGGGAGYTSVTSINSTQVNPVITQVVTPREIFTPSQNISQAFIQIINPFSESSRLVYITIIITMVMMMSMARGRLGSIIVSIIGLSICGYLFNVGSLSIIVIIGIIPTIIIISSMFSDR